ncbi:MAG TPA: ABC transporter permease [Chitinophagaceae bacterium]|nr:ABC transporter permease [Chitinophagaceae bacterium]
MLKAHGQVRGAVALAKASLIAIIRSPTSVVFSLLFPVIFIVVFGSMVDPAAIHLKIAMKPGADTTNIIYASLKKTDAIGIDSALSPEEIPDALRKGRLAAMIDIRRDSLKSPYPHFMVTVTSGSSSAAQESLLNNLLNNIIASLDKSIFLSNLSVASLISVKLPGRVYRQIDFILPGQLGFSILMAGVFGSAFLFFNLRKGLVLKRISVTPIRRSTLVAGEMLSRLVYQLISFSLMIALGYYLFRFTLINGFFTFAEMLLFSVLGLIIFMGIGFIISGTVQNESSIAPIANTFTLPQILLCGLFFPIENYPHWLQAFCNLLPLTFFVDGLRKIAFEGEHIWQIPMQVAGLCIWSVVIGVICIKTFKWE